MQTFKYKTNSGKLLLLDVVKSLKKCPPPKLRGKETHSERTILPRNRVVYHKDHPLYGQPRPEGSKKSDITARQDSLATYGFDYSIEPPEVIPDPEREGWYIGIAGWTWDKALDNEDVPAFIYDVIHGGSPIDIRLRKTGTNHHPASAMRKGNTEKSITGEVILAIKNKEVDRENEEALWDFVQEMARDKRLGMRQNIYNAVRKEVPKLDDRIFLWHSEGSGDHSFEHAATKHDIPYAGDKDPSGKDRLGYICEKGGGHGMWMNGITHFTNHEGKKPVEFSACHGSLKTGSIDGPRSVWEVDFSDRHEVVTKFVKLIAGVYDKTDPASEALCKTIEENMKKYFIRSNDGYCHLPQKREPYAPNGGGARETTLVNKFGKTKK